VSKKEQERGRDAIKRYVWNHNVFCCLFQQLSIDFQLTMDKGANWGVDYIDRMGLERIALLIVLQSSWSFWVSTP
jgi:hypothetical protein